MPERWISCPTNSLGRDVEEEKNKDCGKIGIYYPLNSPMRMRTQGKASCRLDIADARYSLLAHFSFALLSCGLVYSPVMQRPFPAKNPPRPSTVPTWAKLNHPTGNERGQQVEGGLQSYCMSVLQRQEDDAGIAAVRYPSPAVGIHTSSITQPPGWRR